MCYKKAKLSNKSAITHICLWKPAKNVFNISQYEYNLKHRM